MFWFVFLIIIYKLHSNISTVFSLYADVEARCQVYHTCLGKNTFQFQLSMENRTMKRKMFHSNSIIWSWQRKFRSSFVVVSLVWLKNGALMFVSHGRLPLDYMRIGRFVPNCLSLFLWQKASWFPDRSLICNILVNFSKMLQKQFFGW